MLKSLFLLLCLILTSFTWSFYGTNMEDDILKRFRRNSDGLETTTEDMGTAPPIETGEAVGPTLGDILSKFSLVVMIAYVIGIGWKLIKIYKGEYVKEEPIYLKYK